MANYKSVEIGDVIGKWLVLELDVKEDKCRKNRKYWICQCECDIKSRISVRDDQLKNGQSTSCGCNKIKYKPINIGDKFGKLTVKNTAVNEKDKNNLKWNRRHWLCECDCKKELIVRDESLKSGHTTCCGCFKNSDNHTIIEAIDTTISSSYKKCKITAIDRGFSFDLTKEEFSLLIQLPCAYSNTKVNDLYIDNKLSNYTKLNGFIKCNGLDRIINDKSYYIGNTVSCNTYVNYAKNKFSYNELIQWIETLKINLSNDRINGTAVRYVNNYSDNDFRKYIKDNFKLKFISGSGCHPSNFFLNKIAKINGHIKEKGKSISLSYLEIFDLITSPCIICNRKVNLELLRQDIITNDRMLYYFNEIDRWDNSIKDYNIDNCRTLCHKCNLFKHTQTVDELMFLISSLKNNLPNLPKTEAEFLELHSPKNTIKRLIEKINSGEIIDYFNELPRLQEKLIKLI